MKLSTIIAMATPILLSGASAGPIYPEAEDAMSVCWRACFHERPHCPPHGWHAKRFRHCWTCCREGGSPSYDYDYDLVDWE
ncbi:hypothetical protein BDV28DRAFT_145432 [Aspergillus coremiiformis]|uniref:Uncharacterized protein n=1 Tax=Aspergillus coremiiformis TaxID=138285 RepID=A0A5N6ZFS1_9EURO|nr:hypothetical protein BDV28DRAFT_145432 [Aspergillus coremiiformis]